MKSFAKVFMVLVTFILVAVKPVYAVPMLELSDGTIPGTVVITDNMAGDLDPTLGSILYVGSVGVFSLNFSAGITMPVLGDSADPVLHINSVDINGTGTGTLTIKFTEIGFGPMAPDVSGFYTAVGGLAGGTVEVTSYYDTGNTYFGTGTTLATTGPHSGAFSDVLFTSGVPAINPFSLTLEAKITHNSPAITSFDAQLSVPEPGTLLLLGSGLIALGLFRRKRIKN